MCCVFANPCCQCYLRWKLDAVDADYLLLCSKYISTEDISRASVLLAYLRTCVHNGAHCLLPFEVIESRRHFLFDSAASSRIWSTVCIADELRPLVGSETSRRGVMRVFELFQHPELNSRLFIVLLEGIIANLFPNNRYLARFTLSLNWTWLVSMLPFQPRLLFWLLTTRAGRIRFESGPSISWIRHVEFGSWYI